jgi:hypothetical protein
VGNFRIATHPVFESIARSEQLRQRFAEISREAVTRIWRRP